MQCECGELGCWPLLAKLEVTDTTVAEGWEIEAQVSREWEGPGFDPESIAARRGAILERGRSQIAD